ncbi:MAG: threonine synthase [Candidatus Caenarcaniphilales bacterium]|nr:threonine synthase [Candidatus Caenarcaniphilales bacterium]
MKHLLKKFFGLKHNLITGHWRGLIENYRDYLTLEPNTRIISLCEGNTPLIPAPSIEQACGVRGIRVFLKFEGANPSGSFKDRGMTMAVTKAFHKGLRLMICASTGNTSASAAAYTACARSLGFSEGRCIVLIPDGYVALGKLAQAIAYGSQVIQIEGNFDQALKIVRELSEKYPIALVNSVNPDRIEGQKTAAYELCDQLKGEAPDYLCIPVGNAGNISAYWRGFKEYKSARRIDQLPKMYGFQAEGAAPIVRGKVIENPETIATAIRIGNPASWQMAVEAAQESRGLIDMVSDAEIIQAYRLIHAGQGITCEPASAASVAGLLKIAQAGRGDMLKPYSKVVCVLTGHGLKDPQTALETACVKTEKCAADREAVAKVLGLI